jgi:hypothetical protein
MRIHVCHTGLSYMHAQFVYAYTCSVYNIPVCPCDAITYRYVVHVRHTGMSYMYVRVKAA